MEGKQGNLVESARQEKANGCDDLPIPTLFSISLLLFPVLNMMLNCINYALCFMTTTDTWNKALVKIPWYRYNS